MYIETSIVANALPAVAGIGVRGTWRKARGVHVARKNEDRITMLETRGSGESIVLASVNTDSYVGEWGKDRSRGWPVLG